MSRWIEQPESTLALLLEPIPGERPCGEWLRYEGVYEQVREARREDDAALPQGVWQSELKRADWPAVEALCAGALQSRSKDLYLAAWLLEAWVQLDGFAGALRGLELVHGLCAAFWDSIYPALSDDLDARLAPIQWINDKLPRRLRLVPLTRPGMENIASYSLTDWDAALRNPSGSAARPGVTLAAIQQSAVLTGRSWILTLHRLVAASLDRERDFDALLDEKAGRLSPGLLQLQNELLAILQLLESLVDSAHEDTLPDLKHKDLYSEENSADDINALAISEESDQGAVMIANPGGRIRSRAEAYQLLEEIAAYLHRVDPHSPTPYLISRAVTWGRMPFDELLSELVRENGDLASIFQLLGLSRDSK
ncbi:type VI secretion system protein TssA [Silvibacterium sp.]|uniref:type VI secretion system protein TssA n=1 Tax=Silvibacterium sp. TaxID=1964179 RepID=UPI0039E45D6F